ncbi:2OG-Fe(II) oxygenase family protein [Psychromarinibacter halotolerans]|uniref:2OG-Fe(II) oxygenase family protein n=1 Tax=Psychromarinibacter halotolerans TaxID=1775175 RepID=A0ABV7GPP4_9RHOB|nr:2OG-Fe(II) oxygenase family protein [Psychromarinibacter halotolerans]MAQ83465.1 hypothetical protein [Maritimibacter sp.]MDF0594648.1 2OG-Fe(II) oxygenase family protein [Psychromarinibacter halotolerans]
MQIERTSFEKRFSTPMFSFEVRGHEAINDALIAEGRALRQRCDGSAKSNRGGWHSRGNLFTEKAPSFVLLSVLAEEAVKQATAAIGKADLDRLHMKLFGWMNINTEGAYNSPHTHPGAHWSGVYYVSQPEADDADSGRIEFLDPRCDLGHWRILDAPALRPKKSFRPRAGEMILFPSYLVHWVHPNATDDERISIAFNATFSEVDAAR